ncbi:MAG: hypothetical protein JO192_13345 [Candidatus Eremiobacteraeota bacterium]|nr:hypothetical protein [Candidatus Eremiobacteraeota bacterium]
MKRLLCALAAIVALGATPAELDSQYVLQRYALAIDTVTAPKAVIFTYTVSQAGYSNVEQRHVIYRSGSDVRDETLAVDGVALVRKIVRISHRDDRYAIARLAPKAASYELLFLRTIKDGKRADYEYEATPLIAMLDAPVDRVTIDGRTYLPRDVQFTTRGPDAEGRAHVEYAAFGKYWMPVVAEVNAVVNGKPARERIVWSDYRFPASLPPSTFEPPRPLPHATLPPV